MTRELIARAIDSDAWTDRADMGMRRETSLRAADRVLAVLPGWQPIETAPMDGSRVLVWSLCEEEVVAAYWNADKYNRKPNPYWDTDHHYIDSMRANPPTHWMPLPAAPTEGQPR